MLKFDIWYNQLISSRVRIKATSEEEAIRIFKEENWTPDDPECPMDPAKITAITAYCNICGKAKMPDTCTTVVTGFQYAEDEYCSCG